MKPIIETTSTITVELYNHVGTDLDICRAAWVSSGNDDADADERRQRGLIRALMRDRHGTPFEDGFFGFTIYAPRGVRDEHTRHRIGSYSSESLRYRKPSTVMYVPPPHRPLEKAEGFKQIQPRYQPYAPEKYKRYRELLEQAYNYTYLVMAEMEREGIHDTEAMRWMSHDGLMVKYRARFNPRSLMHFLSLRTHDESANHVSFPMWEIEFVARQIESYFATCLPITHSAWQEFGREAP